MKRTIFFLAVLLLKALASWADAPLITIVSPNGHYPLFKNETEVIHWTHSGFFDAHPQNCEIYCGGHVISSPVPVTGDSFAWTVGRKADGNYLPQGIYKITIESPDFDALNGPTVIISDERPLITITAPVTGTTLTRGSSYTIRWTHSSYFQVVPQTCRIFCADSFISPPVPVLDREYTWTVGKKDDGSYFAAGTYPITLESDDYDALGGPNITIKVLAFKIPGKRFFRKIPLHKIPDCPMCFRLDPNELGVDSRDFMEPVTILIVRNGRTVAKLGRFGAGLALPGSVKITLERQHVGLIRNRQPGFEVHILSAKGKILQQHAVQLEIINGTAR
jgi:hypothetical protein